MHFPVAVSLSIQIKSFTRLPLFFIFLDYAYPIYFITPSFLFSYLCPYSLRCTALTFAIHFSFPYFATCWNMRPILMHAFYRYTCKRPWAHCPWLTQHILWYYIGVYVKHLFDCGGKCMFGPCCVCSKVDCTIACFQEEVEYENYLSAFPCVFHWHLLRKIGRLLVASRCSCSLCIWPSISTTGHMISVSEFRLHRHACEIFAG